VLSSASGELEVNRCKLCGFVYLASWEHSLRQSERLYDYYDRFSDEDVTRRYSPENQLRQQALLKEIAGYTRGRRLLDVGCGIGQLLQTAKDGGWTAHGIDLSEAAIQLCRGRGLSASKTDFFDQLLDEQRFDVIIMSELIEHVPSPQRFLKRAEELLDVDGVLYLTTPNFASLARRLLGESWSVIHPEHIGYFERSTLSKMVSEETGLREIRIEANNVAPSTFFAWLRRRNTSTVAKAQQAHREARQDLDQRMRRVFQRSRVLSASKDLINSAASRAGLGDTLVAWLQKPPA